MIATYTCSLVAVTELVWTEVCEMSSLEPESVQRNTIVGAAHSDVGDICCTVYVRLF